MLRCTYIQIEFTFFFSFYRSVDTNGLFAYDFKTLFSPNYAILKPTANILFHKMQLLLSAVKMHTKKEIHVKITVKYFSGIVTDEDRITINARL